MFRRRKDEDFGDEIQSHLDLETERLIADGMAPDAARDAARRAFGNVTRARERFHEASRWMWLEQLAQDLRYAARTLTHNRGFFATAVLTLAIGIGLATTAFTIFNAYVLKPYAVQDPRTLHKLTWYAKDDAGASFRWREYEAIASRDDIFPRAVAESTRYVSSNGRTLAVALVSPNYFEALAPPMRLGRGLASFDRSTEAAVLGEQAWARLFDRDPAVLGRTLDVAGRPYTIVGVAAEAFGGLGDLPRDAWLPFPAYAATAHPALIGPDQPPTVEILGRLADPLAAPRVGSALGALLAESRRSPEPLRVEVTPQPSANPPSAAMIALFSPVFAMFALVLMTACANVSNVMLARAIARHREIAVRLSLGASRGRIVRQLLTEGLLIAAVAGLLALALAAGSLRALTSIVFATLPPSITGMLRATPMAIDHRVFIFALAAAAISTLMFALVPALHASRLGLTDALRGQGGDAARSSRLRGLLVGSQVAVSLVLVVVALTLARNGAALDALDLGYNPNGILSINVREKRTELIRPLAESMAIDPRVGALAVTGGNPLFRSDQVAAAPAQGGSATPTRYSFVSPEYFALMGIPVVEGRAFSRDEGRREAAVAVVSAATAHAFWPGEHALGRAIRIERPEGRPVDDLPEYTQVTVVGIVPDVISGMIVTGKDHGHIYLPTSEVGAHGVALLVRPRSAGALGPETLQQLFATAAPDPQAFEALPLEDMRALQVYPLLAASWLGTLLGGMALVLSVSGLYGVLAYTFSQRTREIGIRMALGATASGVIHLVLRQSARLAGYGAGFGFVVALAAMLGLRSAIHLDAVTVFDAWAFVAAVLVVLAATALAAWQPARRAARIDPAVTLRAE